MTDEPLVDNQDGFGAAARRALVAYVAGSGTREVLDELLAVALRSTGSEHGFIRPVRHTSTGAPYLSTHGVSNVTIDPATGVLEVDTSTAKALQRRRTLLTAVMTTGETVVHELTTEAPTDADDPSALPPGVTNLIAFPLAHGGRVLGIVGLANRRGGYARSVAASLAPLLETAALIVHVDGEREAARDAEQRSHATALERADQQRLDFERREAAMLATSLDAIIVLDQQGRVLAWNPAATNMFGHSREVVVGRPLADLLVPHEQRDAFHAGIERFIETGESVMLDRRLDLVAIHSDGSEVTCEVAVTSVMSGGRTRFIGFLRNQSQRVVVDETLRRAKEDAEASNRAKTQFLATVSHEIRTPLNAIIGMSELMLDTELSDEQRGWMRTVQASGDTLLFLVNDLLDLSKIEVGQLDIEQAPFSLPDLVEIVVNSFRQRMRSKGLALEAKLGADVPPFVVGDSNRLRQVLLNLIGNAVKFTSEGGVVVDIASLSCEEPGSVRLRCRVADTGIGIAPQFQSSIFERFYQVDGSNTRSIGGTGLGLAICSSLLALMGGRLELEKSVPGEGSVFAFTIDMPIASTAEAATTGSWPRPATGRTDPSISIAAGGHLLVAEDNRDSRALALRILDRAGFEVDGAADGEQAVDRAQTAPYDLILMDVEMPVLDGLEASRRIRAHELEHEHPRVPIVALTAHALEGYRQRCLGAGMDDYLSKPLRRQNLLDLIARRIDRRPLIVVIDPVFESRLVLQRFLSRDGAYRVVTSASSAAALDLLGRRRVSLVLIDIDSAENGLETARAVRSVERQTGIPIIAITSDVGPDAERRCADAGCDEMLTKPVRPTAVMSAVARHLPEPIEHGDTGPLDASLASAVRPPEKTSSAPIMVAVDPEIADLVPEYLRSRQADVELLNAAVEADDLQRVRIIGHNLKGSAGGYGFHDLGHIGRRLEASATAADRDEIRRQIIQFADYLGRVRASPEDPA